MRRMDRLRLTLVGGAALLAACGASPSQRPEPAVTIAAGDTSAGCGMAIDGSPGPRAEAWVDGYAAPVKFGDTRDFFAWALQPEHRLRLGHLYVQDAATIDWRRPPAAAASFIDARKAWYVAWQDLPGMMGPTFASFARRADAEAFVAQHGGEILPFDAVTPELVGLLAARCPAPGSPAAALAKGCAMAPDAGARLVERAAIGR